MHSLYQQCLRCVGKQVTVYLADGRSQYGVIQSVSSQGIYFMRTSSGTAISSKGKELKLTTADQKGKHDAKHREVFFAPFFIPFAFLTGVALGAAATSPYGYGYGYGYPYYW